MRQWHHLQNIAEKLQPYRNDLDVGLLLGVNASAALVPKELIAGAENEPYAIRTPLGWGVIGWIRPPALLNSNQSSHFAYKTFSSSEVKKMFELDFIESGQGDKVSAEKRQFIDIAENGTHQRPDDHFEMPLPLMKQIHLPNNRNLALRHLDQLKHKMLKCDKYKRDYISCMTAVIEKGYAESVPSDELDDKPGLTWYIPHHGVYHPKEDKLRKVCDCSASYFVEVSSHWLLQGPDLTNSLVGILCRCREHPIAITCDIKGMFHQVAVDQDHRNLMRFLWWDEGDLSQEPKDYRMTVHLFGATSSPACANYALKHTAELYQDKFEKQAAEFVQNNFLCRRWCTVCRDH